VLARKDWGGLHDASAPFTRQTRAVQSIKAGSGTHPAEALQNFDEFRLVAALRQGDESAFAALLDRYAASMIRISMLYVSSWSVAEEVVQETWICVLRGLNGFQGRSSLRTWIFRILENCAKKRARREGRSIPFSSVSGRNGEANEPSVEPERFFDAAHPRWPRCWSSLVDDWADIPEDSLLWQEAMAVMQRELERLPANQRAVMTLRDVEGWPAHEVCSFLAITQANQRVLLHRARSRVRRAMERYLDEARLAA
jgi:RNA polymerase sigma-70 factor, ECF subfamily